MFLFIFFCLFQVFCCYRKLLYTCKNLFANDPVALAGAQQKVKEAFLKQKTLTDPTEIKEQIKIALETEEFLRQGVVQAKLDQSSNIFKVNITSNTKLHENVPLKASNVIDLNKYEVPCKYKSKE